MTTPRFKYAEILVDRLILESFANEQSAYHQSETTPGALNRRFKKFRGKLRWHISHSLSRRQKEVLQLVLSGKTEREIAEQLGITQQVVNIYKHRAIKKLHSLIAV